MDSDIRVGVGYGLISVACAFFSQAILSFLGFLTIGSRVLFPVLISPGGLLGAASPLVFIIWVVVVAPITEEFFFRFVPIRLIEKFFGSRKNFRIILWTVVVLSSIMFGYIHGSWVNIPLQGVSGFIFSLAFLRKGYLCSVTAHATHNAVIILIAVIMNLT